MVEVVVMVWLVVVVVLVVAVPGENQSPVVVGVVLVWGMAVLV